MRHTEEVGCFKSGVAVLLQVTHFQSAVHFLHQLCTPRYVDTFTNS